MLTFSHAKGRFNYRSVGVVLHQQRVLIHRAETDCFWTLPGGRVEFGESADCALVREFSEELAVAIEVKRLLWVVENFFRYEGEAFHEIAFYFYASLSENSELLDRTQPFLGYEDDKSLIFQWQPLEQLQTILLYPTFLSKALLKIPSETEYLIHKDESIEIDRE